MSTANTPSENMLSRSGVALRSTVPASYRAKVGKVCRARYLRQSPPEADIVTEAAPARTRTSMLRQMPGLDGSKWHEANHRCMLLVSSELPTSAILLLDLASL